MCASLGTQEFRGSTGRVIKMCSFLFDLAPFPSAWLKHLRRVIPTPKSKSYSTYLFRFNSQTIPHRCHNFGHLTEAGVGIGALDGSLRVTEEQGVRGDGFRGLVGVLLSFPLWGLLLCDWLLFDGLFHDDGALLCGELEGNGIKS